MMATRNLILLVVASFVVFDWMVNITPPRIYDAPIPTWICLVGITSWIALLFALGRLYERFASS